MISRREKVAYGFGDTASNLIFQTVMLFLAFFYTDIFGISAATVGTMFLVVRLLDAVTDPLMGFLADNTRTRHGQFRPYLLWLAIPFAVCSILAFTTPDIGDTGKVVYAYVTYAMLMLAYTAINMTTLALIRFTIKIRSQIVGPIIKRIKLAKIAKIIINKVMTKNISNALIKYHPFVLRDVQISRELVWQVLLVLHLPWPKLRRSQ